MSKTQTLYIWLEGDFERPPTIEVKVAPEMPLPQFRNKYVNTEKSHLVMHIYAATDDDGNSYEVAVQPVKTPIQKPSSAISGTPLKGIKGIGPSYAAKLHAAGIESIEELREAGVTPAKRVALSKRVDRNQSIILRWVQIADLMRIEGVGTKQADLLWEAGVKAPVDLPPQQPNHLLLLLRKINGEKQIIKKLPSSQQLAGWIDQAEKLPVLIKI
jgi:predicted flap endonuclease-1-like 5' DNA nuclease